MFAVTELDVFSVLSEGRMTDLIGASDKDEDLLAFIHKQTEWPPIEETVLLRAIDRWQASKALGSGGKIVPDATVNLCTEVPIIPKKVLEVPEAPELPYGVQEAVMYSDCAGRVHATLEDAVEASRVEYVVNETDKFLKSLGHSSNNLEWLILQYLPELQDFLDRMKEHFQDGS